MSWQTPKTDWNTNPKSPMAEDFNRIEENIEFLNNDIETKKGVIVDALNTVGIATLISDTHVQIASKIIGAEKTGVSITPSTVNQAIPKGIYDTGGGLVLGDPDLISANIKANKNIFDVQGDPNVVDTSPGTAIAADILAPKIAFVDGAQITGSMPNRGTVNQTLTKQGQQYIITAGKHNGDGKVTATFANLTPGNVKEGVNVGDVVGNYSIKIKRIFRLEPLVATYSFALSPACALANSIAFLSYCRNTTGYTYARVDLSTTAITVSNAANQAQIDFIEFEPGVIKSIQIKTSSFPVYTSQTTDIPINAVDMSKSMIYPMSANSDGIHYGKFITNNTIRIHRNGSTGSDVAKVCVVEFY